jgi:nucleoside-diphosphate-sugar epimerase
MAVWRNRLGNLRFLSWEDWKQTVSEKDAAVTMDQIRYSSHYSIEKARKLLGYKPRFLPPKAVKESVTWPIDNGVIARRNQLQ